ncbi:MAG: hypothetical protein RIR36_24 [Bacteroidota bacterium]|jgi:hypothetical protein
MKKIITVFALSLNAFSFAQVGIGTTSPNASAVLELSSNTKGFLPPRMTTVERDAITSPQTGLVIYNTTLNFLQFYNGVQWANSGTITLSPSDTYNPSTGKIWMAKNLGASQIATSSTDHLAFGSLFQWGRPADGHELMNWTSATEGTPVHEDITLTLSSSDSPGHNIFIRAELPIQDWRDPQNNNLWQGINGINNPCPSGYRLPTAAEWDAERLSWTSNDAAGAFASPLKLPKTGLRSNRGALRLAETQYWSSTSILNEVTPNNFIYLNEAFLFNGTNSYIVSTYHAQGMPVRCIKN